MTRQVVTTRGSRCIIIMDSITEVQASDAGQAVVSASHGGKSAGEYACRYPLGLVFFNDAGGGKDSAGTAALSMLAAQGRPAATVAHWSARIGDVLDHWENGRISALNADAARLGLTLHEPVSVAACRWLDSD